MNSNSVEGTIRDSSGFDLAIETSRSVGSVALGRDQRILEARALPGDRAHAVDLLPVIDQLCKTHGADPHSIRRVFVSIGPGSFTGVRIGVTVGRMLALAQDAELYGIPTLQVIAWNAIHEANPPPQVVVVLDAKRGRAYAAAFHRSQDGYSPLDQPSEVEVAGYLSGRDRDCAVMGDGIHQHRAAVEGSGLRILADELYHPRAENVLRIGWLLCQRGEKNDPRNVVPVYVRPPEAEEKWASKHGMTP